MTLASRRFRSRRKSSGERWSCRFVRIVNASPLILLARMDCLELLREPPDSEVTVPDVAFQEVLAGEWFDPHVGPSALRLGIWLRGRSLSRRPPPIWTRINSMPVSWRSCRWQSRILEQSSCSTTGGPQGGHSAQHPPTRHGGYLAQGQGTGSHHSHSTAVLTQCVRRSCI